MPPFLCALPPQHLACDLLPSFFHLNKDGFRRLISQSALGSPALLEAKEMFARKLLVSLVFAAVFAQALAALAEYAAVKSAASMSTVVETTASLEAPTS